MPGSIGAQLLRAEPRFDAQALGSVASDGLAPGSTAGSGAGSGAPREPHAEPPLLRGDGGGLVGGGSELGGGPLVGGGAEVGGGLVGGGSETGEARASSDEAEPDRVQSIVSQLLPIQSRAALLSSFEREANPNDEFVRRAYECVWADLVLGVARAGTRRARVRATMAQARGGALRGRG